MLWESPSSNKVYAVCNIEIEVTNLKIKAIIIDLSEALDWLNTTSETEINIININNRSTTEIKGSSPAITNSDVYIGYIKANEKYFKRKLYLPADNDYNRDYQPVHTLSLDRISSVLTFSHLIVSFYEENSVEYSDGFVDTYILDGNIAGYNDSPPFYGIEDNPNYSDAINPVIPSSLRQDGKPIRYTEFNSITSWPDEGAPHETHAHKKKAVDMNGNPIMNMMEPANNYVENTVSLNVASFYSGHVVIDIDYSDPFDCQVDYVQAVPSDGDKEYPKLQDSPDFSNDGSWVWQGTHSFASVHVNMGNHFFITAAEMAGQTINYNTTDQEWEPTLKTTVDGAYYLDDNYGYKGLRRSTAFLNGDEDIFDDRRIGTYFKIWGADRGHNSVKGVGEESNDSWDNGGPLTSYNVREQTQTDRESGNLFPAMSNNSISSVDVSANGNTEKSPNSIHHFKTIYDATGKFPGNMMNANDPDSSLRREIYVSAYTQGVRVIDLKNFIKQPSGVDGHGNHIFENEIVYDEKPIFESAYFDFYPTINYNKDDRYFYLLSGYKTSSSFIEDVTNDEYKYTPEDMPEPQYYMGIWDIVPDSRRDDYAHDEDFVYAYGYGGTQAPYLKKGGYLILRYFRDEIGGVISGNNPTTPVLYKDMEFRKVNLQGDFKVERDVTIASGAEVWLLSGDADSDSTHRHSSFIVGSNGMKEVIVNGTLHISHEDGKNDGSGIDVEVPITVNSNGKLYVHKIRDAKDSIAYFNKTITVKNNGYLEIDEEAKAMFHEIYVEDGGTMVVKEGAEISLLNNEKHNNHGYHYNYGNLKIEGTSTNPVIITGDLQKANATNPQHSDLEEITYLYVRPGSSIMAAKDDVYIEYTNFKGVHVQVVDKKIDKIENNSFVDKSDEDYFVDTYFSTPQLLVFSNPNTNLPFDPGYREFNIKNNVFKDLNTNTTFIDKNVGVGLYVFGHPYKVTVEGNGFENLQFGSIIDQTTAAFIKENNFNEMYFGLTLKSTSSNVCSNNFTTNVLAISTDLAKVTNYFDNDFEEVGYAIKSINSGSEKLRNNEIDNYYQGIYLESSTGYLRGTPSFDIFPYCPLGEKVSFYGRNEFISVEDLSYDNPYVNYYDDYKRSDIYLHDINADVLLSCGKNKMSKYTPYHIYYKRQGGDPIKIIDGDVNYWQNEFSPTYPRGREVIINAPTQNISERLDDLCGFDTECPCKSLGHPLDNCGETVNKEYINIGNWLNTPSLIGSSTFKDDAFNFYNNNVDNLSLSIPCRKAFMLGYIESAILGDSVLQKLNIVNNKLSTMFYDTSYTNEEKINIGYFLAEGFERVGNIDSSKIILNEVSIFDFQPFFSRANWELNRIESLYMANPDSAISFNHLYLHQMTERYKIRFDTAGYTLKPIMDSETTEIIISNSKLSIIPNPSSGKSLAKLELKESGVCTLILIDNKGNEVLKIFKDKEFELGKYEFDINGSNLSSGTYICLLKINGQIKTEKFIILK